MRVDLLIDVKDALKKGPLTLIKQQQKRIGKSERS